MINKQKEEALRVLNKYPDRIPVICEKNKKSDVPEINKKKFLVPKDLTVGQFIYIIRKRINIKPEKAIFLFINRNIPPTGELIGNLYEKNKDKTGFLTVVYSSENTFG